jgi:hypothetical protein
VSFREGGHLEGGSNRRRKRLIAEHWRFTAHRVLVRTDGQVSCSECDQSWQLRRVDIGELAAFVESVNGELVEVHVLAAE